MKAPVRCCVGDFAGLTLLTLTLTLLSCYSITSRCGRRAGGASKKNEGEADCASWIVEPRPAVVGGWMSGPRAEKHRNECCFLRLGMVATVAGVSWKGKMGMVG